MNVRAVLETKSPKYQSLISFGGVQIAKPIKEVKKEEALKIDFIENQTSKPKMTKPVIVPSAVDTKKVTKLSRPQLKENISAQPVENDDRVRESAKNRTSLDRTSTDLQDILDAQLDEIKPKEENKVETIKNIEEQPKRGRGRPKKIVDKAEEENKVATPKRGRGRPKKIVESTIEQEEKQNSINLFDLDEEPEETILPGIEETIDNLLPGFEKEESNATILPGLENEETSNFEAREDFYKTETSSNNQDYNNVSNYNYNNLQEDTYSNEQSYSNEITKPKNTYDVDIQGLLSRDKKIVSFVGTTKNGTSFLVNNLGELFSSMGINTAILDVTKNRNSYYIYTKNEEELRRVALNSMKNLSIGQASGIQVNRNLTVYTSVPTEENNENCGEILATLVKNYSLVLIDCDFDTDIAYFENSQEIYLVQSMDILTIQPLTAFLRDLKAKNVLSQDKIRIVINKEARIRTLTPKVIIGGMAYYNDPSMSFMTELFNKDNVRHCTIPFDEQVYSKYLEGLVNCNVSLNGYPKTFMMSLKELGNMVYPLLNNKYKPVDNYDRKGGFSSQMNSTLEQMKRKF